MSVVAQKQWTKHGGEELTLELLGNLLHKDPTARRGELLAKGAAMPVDSLDMFDILKEFHERTGLKIRRRKCAARLCGRSSVFRRVRSQGGEAMSEHDEMASWNPTRHSSSRVVFATRASSTNLSQQFVSEQTGIPRSAISRYRAGKPSRRELKLDGSRAVSDARWLSARRRRPWRRQGTRWCSVRAGHHG